MGLGAFHKKKRYCINKVKINFLSFFFSRKKNDKINADNIKTCLLIHDNNKLGDLIVLSSLYRELSNRGVKLSILTTEMGKAFLSGNSRIHQFYIKKSNAISDVLALRKQLSGESFDIVLDPFETMPSFGHSVLLSGVRHSHILGFDKWYKRYYTVYHPHDEMLTAHMCTRASEILRHFYGAERNEFDVSYDLPLPASVEKDVLDFIGDSQIIIINALGAKKICRLSGEQISTIYSYLCKHYPEYRIIFTGLAEDIRSIPLPGIESLPFKEFIYTVALTKFSQYVISVDTALVHIASAYEIPTLALYPNARQTTYPSHLIWAPNNCNALQIVSPTYTVRDIRLDVLTESVEDLLSTRQK
ncbi:glycosyltransferase family 9 protein [Citrobacter farmeri]|uniref:glycosyltransferase family 9 protein n=1 Tax=Citrobacter farmeri TaxID=67824 RepID=UPI00189BE1D8|nr:glycosyltransferase family 9 protein [Citrobacter farmeri]EKU0079298.1 glycosyltransferase family 9 protein [Citrobacter farmeri]MBJ9134970.1 glycosyltransferase family 9 protein [Citrobacter farmeri]MDB2169648.1 glycosyltransferase family 9 protein [Citrobacter farmeri]MDZ7528996.1 glycosyltransferase family 9 protein [Citrobacter farmeri]HCC5835705.1 glycosyltransferase family 9 protein [Citrobacter farmeri]